MQLKSISAGGKCCDEKSSRRGVGLGGFESTCSAPEDHSGITVVLSLEPGTSDPRSRVCRRCIWKNQGTRAGASHIYAFELHLPGR